MPTHESSSTKLWGGRFSADMAEIALTFSQSIEADSRMAAEDIWGSEAHALMLARYGIISAADLRAILTWLERAREDLEAGRLELKPELEDIHMNVETYVRQGAGAEMGGRLHTGRSRNDQVVTDCRMHLRARLLEVMDVVSGLQAALLKLARGRERVVMPGYTHTQHAQPISVAFWLSSYVSMLARDQERLWAAFDRTNRCTLGAAALAGTSFPTDRDYSAKLMGFDAVLEHSLDAVGSRDFVAEALAALSIMMSNLSKLAEEFVLFSTFEYRLIEIHDSLSSGSSIMPQKKNPCIAELSRARVGLVYGRLMEVLTLLKALPSGYNRDLQQDKPPLWQALDETQLTLRALEAMVGSVKLNARRMRELVGMNFATATELANYLVAERGLPFRDCHEIVGGIVAALIAEGGTLDDHARVQELLQARGQELTLAEIAAVCDPQSCLERQRSLGSTGPENVKAMLGRLAESVRAARRQSATARRRLQAAREKTARLVADALVD